LSQNWCQIFVRIFNAIAWHQKPTVGFNPITLTVSENSNYWRKSLLEVIRQNIAVRCQKTFENKKFVEITQQCFALTPQANFLAYDLNFH
jgi:hypothetical protein